MTTLEIRVFGTLVMERDGQPLDRFPSRQVKGLLSYLLLNRDTVHPREHLAGLFWGDLDDRRARHCLNTALWRLHRILAPPDADHDPYLRVDAHSIGFNTSSDFRLDLADFEQYCARAEHAGRTSRDLQAQLFRQAVDLHAGDLLTYCYEDWCLIERERVQRLYLRALGFLMSYHAERDDYPIGIDYAHRILAVDPLREEVHRDLIDMHLASRQPAKALRRYHICEEILQRELGIEPMVETKSRFDKIMAASGTVSTVEMATGRSSSLAGAPNSTPMDMDVDVDVDVDLAQLMSQLDAAAASFERAYSDLRQAMATVQQATRAMQAAQRGDELAGARSGAREPSRRAAAPAAAPRQRTPRRSPEPVLPHA
jgi:DNA-binding SARP family transcriptional activator